MKSESAWLIIWVEYFFVNCSLSKITFCDVAAVILIAVVGPIKDTNEEHIIIILFYLIIINQNCKVLITLYMKNSFDHTPYLGNC